MAGRFVVRGRQGGCAVMGRVLEKRISLLLVDDNRLVREGLRALLTGMPGVAVVAAVGNIRAAVEQARELQPDVALVQVPLGDHHGLELVRALRESAPQVRVIVFDLVPAQGDLLEFVQAGASGFVLKEATFADLVHTIRAVARGERVLPPPLADSLFAQIARQGPPFGRPIAATDVRLTKREREVIALIAEGLSNQQIGERLRIATYTVKSHVHSVLEKLMLRSRFQVASYARGQH